MYMLVTYTHEQKKQNFKRNRETVSPLHDYLAKKKTEFFFYDYNNNKTEFPQVDCGKGGGYCYVFARNAERSPTAHGSYTTATELKRAGCFN